MHVVSLGKVVVPSPGSPVLLGAILTALNVPDNVLPDRKCHRIEAWPLLANTGAVFFGLSSTARAAGGVLMSKSSGKNVIKQLQVPASSGHQDFAELSAGAGNSILVDDYAIDSTNAGEGLDIFLTVQ